jgi:hypothetical protein
MKKIEALSTAVLIHGVMMPSDWAAAMERHAYERRITRAELVREAVSNWLQKHPEYEDVHAAAVAHNRNYSQQIRQIMEDELPTLCPPILEWRGDGARHAAAIRRGRATKRMVDTISITLPPHGLSLLRKIAKAKPEMYPDAAAVAIHVLTRWVESQLAKQEQGK